MRHAIFAIIIATALVTTVPAQNILFGSVVGVAQTVPDPISPLNPPGSAKLYGTYCSLPVRKLYFDFICLPLNYVIPVFTETCYFVVDAGPATLPGVPILQGQFYVPFTPAAVIINAGGVRYIGPADVVCLGSVSGAGPTGPCTHGRMGVQMNLGSSVAGLPIGSNFTIQAAMFDPVANRFFTSNALNFSTIP